MAMRTCAACNTSLDRTSFSRNQWSKGPEKCRCKACVGKTRSASRSTIDKENDPARVGNRNGSCGKGNPPRQKKSYCSDYSWLSMEPTRKVTRNVESEVKTSWNVLYGNYLCNASREDANEFARKLYKKLYETDSSAALAFTSEIKREIRMKNEKNFVLDGEWLIKYGKGAYNFLDESPTRDSDDDSSDYGFSDDDFCYDDYSLDDFTRTYEAGEECCVPKLSISIYENSSAEADFWGDELNDYGDMRLLPTCNVREDEELVFVMETNRWEDGNGFCDDHDFKVSLSVKHVRDSDTIEGTIKSVPSVQVEKGRPSCDYGGEFSFVGYRFKTA